MKARHVMPSWAWYLIAALAFAGAIAAQWAKANGW
jgi:hypothetical protein